MKHRLVMGGYRAPSQNVRLFMPGTVLDLAMRDWMRADGAGPTLVERAQEHFVAHAAGADGGVKWKTATDEAETLAAVVVAARRLEVFLRDRIMTKPYAVDFRFRRVVQVPALEGRTMLPVRFQGALDLIYRDEAGLHHRDLKMTANADYARKVIGQLTFYDIVLELELGERPTSAGLLLPGVRDAEVDLPIVVDDQARREMWARIIDMVDGQLAQAWTTRQELDSVCRACEVHHGCPRWVGQVFTDDAGRKRASFG